MVGLERGREEIIFSWNNENPETGLAFVGNYGFFLHRLKLIWCVKNMVGERESDSFTYHTDGTTHRTWRQVTCTIKLIYTLSCKLCGVQCIGETSTIHSNGITMVTDPSNILPKAWYSCRTSLQSIYSLYIWHDFTGHSGTRQPQRLFFRAGRNCGLGISKLPNPMVLTSEKNVCLCLNSPFISFSLSSKIWLSSCG